MTTNASTLTRQVDGKTVPVAGTYQLDPTHTSADFVAKHLMVTKVRGGFENVSGSFEVAEDVTASTVEVTIETGTISSGTSDRDAHLKSPDFLDVEAYPTIRFAGTGVEPAGENWKLNGDLTIKDVTRPVSLDLEFLGVVADPWGNDRLAFTASTQLVRDDWGLTWNVALEGGGVLVSKKVSLDIEVQALPA